MTSKDSKSTKNIIIVSQCLSNKKEWLLTSHELISFFQKDLETKFLTTSFSEALNYAKQNQLNYISIFDDVISKKDALINDYYLNDNKFDHHLSASKCADLWFKKLKPIF